MKNRPTVNLCHGFDRCGDWKWTFFGLASDIGAGLSSEPSPEAVEDEYRRAIALSLDYVPGLRDSELRKLAGQWSGNFGARGSKPPLRGRSGSNVLETPP